jgi:hypothetical protein
VDEEAPPQLSPGGRLPGWTAVVGMAICPFIGVFIVGLTTWKLRSKVVVGVGGTILWIAAFGLFISTHPFSPTAE